ncbi:MAG TPA: hypothetical protein VH183_08510 [Burkholderiaceae bacterium]|jgi:hypothetical protein|nr:hypothetical protein [Burkholderiaceae bacterium]
MMSAAAAFSGSMAVFCLGTAIASRTPGPAGGFLAGLIAAVALARAVRGGPAQAALLRIWPGRGVLSGEEDGDGELPYQPIGVTRNLICLARNRRRLERWPIWRDSIAPDAFRRIAAYGLWRRGAAPETAVRSELIARKTVTEGPLIPRIGRPQGQ